MLLFNYLDTLPKLYHFCSNRRDVYVSELRKFERICLKVTKLRLDTLYFGRCINLRICPKFLMFKPPKLKAYNKTDNIKAEILKNQIGILRKELQTTCDQYRKLKSTIHNKLSFLEYTILMSKLNKKCRMDTLETQQRHQRKLTNLWKS